MLHSTLYDLFSFGKGGTSTDTLQVPCFATDSVPSSSSHSPSKLRVSLENSKKAVRNWLNLSNLLISRSRLRNIWEDQFLILACPLHHPSRLLAPTAIVQCSEQEQLLDATIAGTRMIATVGFLDGKPSTIVQIARQTCVLFPVSR
jgi:hypothetical protein